MDTRNFNFIIVLFILIREPLFQFYMIFLEIFNGSLAIITFSMICYFLDFRIFICSVILAFFFNYIYFLFLYKKEADEKFEKFYNKIYKNVVFINLLYYPIVFMIDSIILLYSSLNSLKLNETKLSNIFNLYCNLFLIFIGMFFILKRFYEITICKKKSKDEVEKLIPIMMLYVCLLFLLYFVVSKACPFDILIENFIYFVFISGIIPYYLFKNFQTYEGLCYLIYKIFLNLINISILLNFMIFRQIILQTERPDHITNILLYNYSKTQPILEIFKHFY